MLDCLTLFCVVVVEENVVVENGSPEVVLRVVFVGSSLISLLASDTRLIDAESRGARVEVVVVAAVDDGL